MKKLWVVLTGLLLTVSIVAEVDMLEATGDAGGKIWDGIKETFGTVPSQYIYSFQIFNGSSQTINTYDASISVFMHARMKENLGAPVVIGPGRGSSTAFYHRHMYLAVHMHDKNNTQFYRNPIVKHGVPNDPAIYYYHAYEDAAGLHGEYLGSQKTTSTDFVGNIYNMLPTPMELSFPYGKSTFSVTLDKNSFNNLQSAGANNIRPLEGAKQGSSLSIAKAASSVPLSEAGLANEFPGATSTSSTPAGKSTVSPMRYNYNIYNEGTTPVIREGGLTIGNFQQPDSARLRDITPVHCQVWYKSAVDSPPGPEDILIPVDDKSKSLWVGYYTPGWSKNNAQTDQGWVLSRISPGTALDFYLIRPAVDTKATLTKLQQEADVQTKSTLYIALLDTTDNAKAKAFMQNLCTGKIVEPDYSKLDVSPVLKSGSKALLETAPIPQNQGVLKDPTTGVTGIVSASESFSPYGLTAGPYFYSVDPMSYYIAQSFVTFSQYLAIPVQSDGITPDGNAFEAREKDLLKKIQGWVPEYKINPKLVATQVEQYLQQYGNNSLFDVGQDKKPIKTKFNSHGMMAIQMVLYGPQSISNAPTLPGAGVSYFPYTQTTQPEQWVKQASIVSI